MIRVPIKSYLKKFLQKTIEDDQIVLRRISYKEIDSISDDVTRARLISIKRISDIIGNVGLFRTSPDYYKYNSKVFKVPARSYNDFIGVEPTERMIRNKQIFLDNNAVGELNDRIYNWFCFEVCMFLDSEVNAGNKLKSAIFDVMNNYDISFEDISFDGIRKMYDRQRERTLKNITEISEPYNYVVNVSFRDKIQK